MYTLYYSITWFAQQISYEKQLYGVHRLQVTIVSSYYIS